MHSILPFDEIKSRFDKPLHLEQLGMDRFDEVAQRDPNGLVGAALTVWERYLRKHPGTNPGAVRDYIRSRGGDYLHAVQAVIGQPIIHELSFSRSTIDDPELAENLVAYLLVARVYPNEFHIADMSFVNPYEPIPPELRNYKFRRFRGLHLLGTVLERAEAYAAKHHCDYMTLTAPADDLVPLFARHGFAVEDNLATGLAMEKRVAH
jgi:hypothetical protein